MLDRERKVSDGGQEYVIDLQGTPVAVHNDLPASLDALPQGIVAVTVRPLPWEAGASLGRVAASVESVFWLALFVLAAVGFWVRRRDLGAVAFPAALVVSAVLSGAVTQGNLGTAFRHRGQILWALAILSVAAAEHIRDRSTTKPTVGTGKNP